ncbi:MAG: hypothetical protein H6622_00880 [Halobacteriovoraceae bacterium]|nr:hypothetical protein [Halobacteriovoraceae bacterium]
MSIKKLTFNFTACLFMFLSIETFASIGNQEEYNTHLRWKFNFDKDFLLIDKKNDVLEIKSIKTDIISSVYDEINKFQLVPKYIKSINKVISNNESKTQSIIVKLTNEAVDVFSFYRKGEKSYVLDFWIDEKKVSKVEASIKKQDEKKIVEKVALPTITEKKEILLKENYKEYPRKQKNETHRDFRYGGPFVWDYEPLSPDPKIIVDVIRKTPEFFYPIKNREYTQSDMESHLQLTINLYRKEKYGLMYNSINMFNEKYNFADRDFTEYLKSNAILRINFKTPNNAQEKMGITMLKSIAARTQNYDMKKGILKYLLNYDIHKQDYVSALKNSKKLFVITRKSFDIEESEYASRMILFNLGKLNQISKLKDLMNDKIFKKIISKQEFLAYQSYALLKMDDTNELIKFYESQKNSISGETFASIYFNVAEAYFREAKYNEAIPLFDKFIKHYSYTTKSEEARLRIALCYEFLEKPILETTELYKNTVNRSQSNQIKTEAILRYIAITNLRKIDLTNDDKQIRTFLNFEKNNTKIKDRNILKLLWLTRLRLFIIDQNYNDALAYLNIIPVDSMIPSEKRVFEADGAEIVYGLIKNSYEKMDYAKVLKVWEIYKTKYINKVALDPVLNNIVGRSYIRMSLYEGLERLISNLKLDSVQSVKTYPIWVKREKTQNFENIINELNLAKHLALKNYKKVEEILEKMGNQYKQYFYYKGLTEFNKKNYKEAIKNFETFLVKSDKNIFKDPQESADLLWAYTNSLYELGESEKFKRSVDALLEDMSEYQKKNPYIRNVKERALYLKFEMVYSENKPDQNLVLEKDIAKFLGDEPKTMYADRLNYLLGVTYIRNKKDEEGKKLFNNLLENASTSSYIKEMVKSEIGLMKIKEKI